MRLAKLYCRDSNERIRQWEIIVEGNKYKTISGLIDGEKVVSEQTECFGKNLGRSNETTAEEQARKDALSHWKKKVKEGYKENVAEIDNQTFFQPMLAKNYENYKDKIDWARGVVFQCKLNGARIIATRDGLFTRKGERYVSIPHIEKSLKPFFEKFPNAILDGEGFNFELREKLNEIMKLLRKTVHISDEDLKNSEKLVEYHIYDGFGFGVDKNECYLKRATTIKKELLEFKHIKVVESRIAYSEKDLETFYQEVLKQRHEGV